MTDDFVIPEEAVEAAAAMVWEEVWSDAESFADAGAGAKRECRVSARRILEAALPHLRAHPTPVVTRDQLMRLLHNKGAWCGTCDYEGGMDACEDCRKCLGTYADAVLDLIGPTEVETKALAETATKLGYELGRKEALAEAEAAIKTERLNPVRGWNHSDFGDMNTQMYHDATEMCERIVRDLAKGTTS